MKDFTFDVEAGQNFFNQASKLWINPEIENREKAGKLPADFGWSRCRILFREDNTRKVEFDNEIGWEAICKKAPKTVFEYGQDIYL